MSRVAIVTGAARGIGAATVDALVNENYRVVAVDRCRDIEEVPYALATPADLDAVVARHGDAVLGLVGDVRSATDMHLAVETATRHFGRLDAVVACAGVLGVGAPLWEIGDAAFDAVWSVNVLGTRRLIEAAAPVLIANGKEANGRVVAVASAAGHTGLLRLAAYSAREARGRRLDPRGRDGPRALRRDGERGEPGLHAHRDPRRVGHGVRLGRRRSLRGTTAHRSPAGTLRDRCDDCLALFVGGLGDHGRGHRGRRRNDGVLTTAPLPWRSVKNAIISPVRLIFGPSPSSSNVSRGRP
jgi:NADP-dependent 3-hydroxy acid dehydrogenase YdfG